MGKYKSAFQKRWLNDPDFKLWLREHNSDKFSAFCILCKKEFSVLHSGLSDVKSHAKGKNHAALEQSLKIGEQSTLSSFKKTSSKPNVNSDESQLSLAPTADPTGSTANISPSLADPSEDISTWVCNADVKKAEILWAMNKVITHSSCQGAEAGSSIFPIMFPDSVIACKFQMMKDKIAYSVYQWFGSVF